MTEALQRDIIQALQVPEYFDPAAEAERRIQFLKDYLLGSRQESYVLGISGGVDSSTAGRLAQLAVERAREESGNARLRFIAMRLPYGVQRDEADAQRALQFIQPDETHTVNIKPASDAMLASVREARVAFDDELHEDFTLGNIKGAPAHDRPVRRSRRTSGPGDRHRSCGGSADGLLYQVRRWRL